MGKDSFQLFFSLSLHAAQRKMNVVWFATYAKSRYLSIYIGLQCAYVCANTNFQTVCGSILSMYYLLWMLQYGNGVSCHILRTYTTSSAKYIMSICRIRDLHTRNMHPLFVNRGKKPDTFYNSSFSLFLSFSFDL